MPSPPWTTPDQDEFLESKLPEFLAAQRNKTTTDFWKSIYRDFFATWADPQDEVPALTVPKKRKGKGRASLPPTITHTEWVKKRKQQITNWYNNRGSRSHNRRQPLPIVMVGSQSNQRISSEVNLYSKKYYPTRVREKAVEAWKSALQRGETPCRISLTNKVLTQCWNEETEEIRKEIQEEYKALKDLRAQPATTIEKKPLTTEDYAVAQAAIPQTVGNFLSQVADQTGFCCTLITGGPDPLRPGRMRMLAFHEGVDKFGQRFGSAYGSFNANIMEPFQKFLYNVFPEKKENCLVNQIETLSSDQKPAQGESVTDEQEPPRKKQRISESPSPPATAQDPTVTQIPLSTQDPTPKAHSAQSTLEVPAPPAASPSAAMDVPLVPISADGSAASTGVQPSEIPQPSLTEILSTLIVQRITNEPPMDSPVKMTGILPSLPDVQPTPTSINAPTASGISAPGAVDVDPDVSVVSAVHPTTSKVIDTQSMSMLDWDADFLADIPFSWEEFDSTLQSMGEISDWEHPQASALYTSTTQNMFDVGIRPSFTNAAGPSHTTPSSESSGSNPWIPLNIDVPNSSNSGPDIASASFPFLHVPSSASTDGLDVATASFPSLHVPPSASTNGPDIASTFFTSFHIPPSASAKGLVEHDVANPGSAMPNIAPHTPPTPTLPTNVTDGTVPLTSNGPISTPSLQLPAPNNPAGAVPMQDVNLNASSSGSITAANPLGDVDLNVTNLMDSERPTRTRKPPLGKEIQANIWLERAHLYLQKDLDDGQWKNCVERWFEFEKQTITDLDTNSCRIPAKTRPPLLTKWVGSRNYNAIPKPNDEVAFGLEWLNWWNEIQPKWRKSPKPSSLPLSVDTASGRDNLSAVKKFGPTGLVIVLIGLKWWAGTRGTDGMWEAAVADIISCLEKFSLSTPEPSSKRK